MKKVAWPLFIILLLANLNGCGEARAEKNMAEKAVDGFHNKYNAKAFAAIYRGGHENFKHSGKFDDFITLMQAVHSELGKVKSSRNKRRSVIKTGSEKVITLHQETYFANGTAFEVFRYIVKDKKIALSGYKIKLS